MGQLRFVKPEHADIINEYLAGAEKGLVLVMPDQQAIMEKLDVEDETCLGDLPGGYDFGGDADIWLDVVRSDQHYIFTDIAEEQGVDMGDVIRDVRGAKDCTDNNDSE